MSSEPDAQPGGAVTRAESEGFVEPSGRWARARTNLRVPGVLVRLAGRDPHIPQRLTITRSIGKPMPAREWAERARDALSDDQPLAMV
jgi:hypothetical protein